MSKTKLTKRAVESQTPGGRDIILWDSDMKGFGCKVTPKGKRVYFAYYRTRDGQQRRPTIGVHGTITCEQAREIARQWLADASSGGDPSARRKAGKESPTVAELMDRCLARHFEVYNRPRSVEEARRNIRLHVLPAIGNKKVTAVTRADIERIHHRLRNRPGAANKVLALLSKSFNLAEAWGLRPGGTNPCRHIDKYPDRKRERFLSTEEFTRLGEALAGAERTRTELSSVINAIRLLVFTGCRLSEILTLRWEHVDFERSHLRLPESKTGAKVVPLGAPALEVLNSIERQQDNPFVIHGTNPGAHLVNLQKPWRRIRRRAKLDGLRLHDLRHSFASAGAAAGLSLPIIGKMLGHTRAATTQRYAHLAADPVKQAVETVTANIAAAMKGKSAEVVELRGHKR